MKKAEAIPAADARSGGVAGDFMAAALAAARRALLAGEAPIGASIVRDGVLIATSATAVIGSFDVTAHAEVAAIRRAVNVLGTLKLEGCELYVTVEPCAMCAGACHYAGISRIFFGASIGDLDVLTRGELAAGIAEPRRARWMRGGVMREESLALLAAWDRDRGRR